jgi:diacylglycerol O-acyltransferase / wax synthase
MAQGHMDRLTSFDTSFLANEKGNAHMAIGAVLVCEGSAPAQDDFLAQIRSRLHQLPRLRQRLHYPPLSLGTPFWVDHAEFELEQHVRRARLPAPGGEEALRSLVGKLLAPPLERSKPLWELTLVDGVSEGRFAIVYKTHHAMADGISAVDIGMLLFDTEPRDEPVRDEREWRPMAPPSRRALALRAGSGVLDSVRRSLRWLRRAARDPRRAGRRAADGLAGLWEVTWNLVRAAPKVPLNAEVSAARSFGWSTFELADFKHVKNALGGTVNDVTLAVVAGALRRWLAEREVPLDGLELKALVPVSIRMVDEHGELGNKLTAMRGPVPVGLPDPVARLRAISTAMDDLKSSKQPLGAEAIWGLNDWFRDFAPPLLLAPTAAVNFSTRLFNLLLTNFPGPQVPFYVLGRELVEIHPIGFLAHRHALAVAILSYNGRIGFGLLSDPASLPDAENILAHLWPSFEELLAAARIASPHSDDHELAGDDRPGFARDRERLVDR